ncbi:MAG: hypothetical protein QOI98_8 [Solirubrobacteraceae bacterium]|nr:hypothetical protein [Solirubrobacteraceae bacterium]
MVCELCTARAAHEGWIREGLDDSLGVRPRSRGGEGSLRKRLRQRRDAAREAADAWEANGHDSAASRSARRTRPAEVQMPAPQPDRQVQAVPTNADLKVARALDMFNESDHPRTVAGVARSLGAPIVAVHPAEATGSVVSIVVSWELCWYRYEVDLADEAAGVRVIEKGSELGDLAGDDQVANAAADESGELQPAA